MKYLKCFNESNNEEIHRICEVYYIKNYTINNDGSIDVHENVDLNGFNLNKIPINFNYIDGCFDCGDNNLISLEGCPKEVSESFYCNNNQLRTLKFCPKNIGFRFYCNNNKLNSLIGCPEYIDGNFDCSNNYLYSLEGGPKVVQGDFDCSNNFLKTLKGCAKEGISRLNFRSNRIRNLIGLDGKYDNIEFYDNPLPSEIYTNKNFIKTIIKYQDDYNIWKLDGNLDQFRFSEMMKEILNK